MEIQTHQFSIRTKGQGDVIDITPDMNKKLKESGFKEGQFTVFNVGSTAGISTIEFEPGLKKDIGELFDQLAPYGKNYHHHATWGDDNGSSHLRATLQGPALTIPFQKGELLLGTWQQVVLLEFDTRGRDRTIVAQLIGIK